MGLIDQNVTIYWMPSNKDYYESQGYEFTGYAKPLTINAKKLSMKSQTKVAVECDRCGIIRHVRYVDYIRELQRRDNHYFCQKCIRQINKENKMNIFYDYCNKLGYTPVSTIEDYKNSNSKLSYICPLHGQQTTTLNHVSAGNGCKYCGYNKTSQKQTKDINTVIKTVEDKGSTLLNPEDYKTARKSNLMITCSDCGKIYFTNYETIKKSPCHCKECSNNQISISNRMSPDEVKRIIDDLGVTVLNIDEYKGVKEKNLIVVCPICGKSFKQNLALLQSGTIYCNNCKKHSIGEARVEQILLDNDIQYKPQKTFEDLYDERPLLFDFYLPDYNTCIEFDGPQHYRPVFGEKSFQKTIKHDKMKNKYCEDNNIRLIRIPYYEGNHMKDTILLALNIA